MQVRAQRNNNPGNVRVGIKWYGLMDPAHMTPEQAGEKEFCVFQSPALGFRAMATIIVNYHKLHAINTLRGIIARWAPPTENNTGAYLNAICNTLQMAPDALFPFSDVFKLTALCKAIATHECGGWFFSDYDLQTGVRQSV